MLPVRLARPDDLPTVLTLLKDSGLPYQDISAAHLDEFLVIEDEDDRAILGTVGLERYEADALLRSLAVRQESRRAGPGAQLVSAAEEHARKIGLTTLYLLTTTAADFFARRNYEVIAQSDAPPALHATTESPACALHKPCACAGP